jgi:predicted flavoprotein YhiN
MKVIVIGGGPAGMIAAIASSKNGNDVTVLEKMDSLR